jgi:hypothetical protein
MLENLHPREEVTKVVGDEILERKELNVVEGRRRVDPNEPGQHLRNLEPRELLAPGLRVAHTDREIEREA